MRKALFVSLALAIAVSVATGSAWEFSYEPAQVRFATFGGGLGDPVTPTAQDTKIAFELHGKAARQMFEVMGPDKADACGSGGRFRSRDEDRLVCTRSPKGEYTCYFGFDLKTGRSIGGSLC